MNRSTIENKHRHYVDSFNDAKTKLSEDIHKLKQLISTEKSKYKQLNLNKKLAKLEIKLQEEMDKELDYLLDVAPLISDVKKEQGILESLNGTMNNFVEITTNNNGQIYDEFLKKIENKISHSESNIDIYICADCNIPKLMDSVESCIICPNCGKNDIIFDATPQGLSYDQEINSEVNICFSYKRINHFNEWLAQFQAKEATEIPQDIINLLINEFKKIRITNNKDITLTQVKKFLKKLKLNKYYEHAANITNTLSGIKPKTMNLELEERLRSMFRDIQIPFEKHKPKNRSNFLSYSYCLYKFCELLGEHEYLELFPLLKSREKLFQQDAIWKNICKELDYKFIPTV